ncbi:MAG TPA: hypothetical protein VFS08_12890 [Gemmatimonadaceae bacterium]|nr:hypothetical protein [Gemmatimonadaceae bacterium]
MSPSAYRSEAATLPPSRSVGAPRPGLPPARGRDGVGEAPAVADDHWATGIDLLILRVADRLRRTGVDLPEARLHGLAEQLVLDATRVVLDWVEAGGTAAPAPVPAGAVAPAGGGGAG